MKTDELAFFNQQLALMLRDGIPLESALKQLAGGMREGPLRTEAQALEADLGRGTPLPDALSRRQLPEFYKRMLAVGAKTNDLPGMLTLLADHYHRSHALWTRLKGLMTYPFIVILVSLSLTLILGTLFGKFSEAQTEWMSPPDQRLILVAMWVPPILLGIAALLLIVALWAPGVRRWLRWKLPAFREASLAQLASALALMVRQGAPLPEALALAESLEANTPAAKALQRWRNLLAAGQGKLTEWQDSTRSLPPLFTWLVKSSHEDPAAGFQKAADLYQARAAYRTDLMLYGALPISVLLLGQLILWQVVPMIQVMVRWMNMLGDMGM